MFTFSFGCQQRWSLPVRWGHWEGCLHSLLPRLCLAVGGARALRAPQPCHYGLSDRTHVTFSVVDKLRPLPHATPTSPCWRPPPGRPKRIYFYSEQFCFFPRRKENSLGNDFKSQVLGSSCPCPSPILFRTNFMDFFFLVYKIKTKGKK